MAEKRGQYLSLRVTTAQRDQLRKSAESRGMTVSDYVLERLFGTSASSIEKASNKATERKLDAIIRALIENHRITALAAGAHLLELSPDDRDELGKYRDEQYQTILGVLGDEGRVKI